ncbi:hypothetical protein LIER_21325 [Lithospermum erythrorhizon]|uniref:Uncharacterized protein n=1 Tax=Lithospermum erythrorhizon TaxID=34254 RepID=A0AAV3QTA4_LITER
MSNINCCTNCTSITLMPTNSCNNFMQEPIKRCDISLIYGNGFKKLRGIKVCRVRASMVDSFEGSSSFAQRIERAWLIAEQPRPITCSSCDSNGHVECQWCRGTGFFIIGDNMLCEVPSRNTTCVICAGKGATRCSDCKGTGFRAKWLDSPPIST